MNAREKCLFSDLQTLVDFGCFQFLLVAFLVGENYRSGSHSCDSIINFEFRRSTNSIRCLSKILFIAVRAIFAKQNFKLCVFCSMKSKMLLANLREWRRWRSLVDYFITYKLLWQKFRAAFEEFESKFMIGNQEVRQMTSLSRRLMSFLFLSQDNLNAIKSKKVEHLRKFLSRLKFQDFELTIKLDFWHEKKKFLLES